MSFILSSVKWGFTKSWGYPQSSSILDWDFPLEIFTIQRFWGTPMTCRKPLSDGSFDLSDSMIGHNFFGSLHLVTVVFSHPSEKYDFVNWDDDYSQY